MNKIRYCKLRDTKVIIAPNRVNRPTNFKVQSDSDDISLCPFEKGNERFLTKEIFSIKDENNNWSVKVVPNLYNVLDIGVENYSKREGFFTYESGFGAHEVIIETPLHDITMDRYTKQMWSDYLEAIKHRLEDLSKDKRLKYIQVFKNYGFRAGATLKHPHSQLIATPFVPKEIKREFKRSKRYFKTHQRALLDDIIYEELRVDKRVIYKNSNFVAFAPFASLYPFEIIIAPKIAISSMIYLDYEALVDLVEVLEIVYKKLYKTLGDFHYNMIFKNALEDIDYFRSYIHIIPRIYTLAGFEISTGMRVNPFSPELVSKELSKKELF